MTDPTPGALGPVGRAVLTTGGLGYLRPFPGTWGSIPPTVIAGLLILAGAVPSAGVWEWILYHVVLFGVLIVSTLACAVLGDAAEALWRRKDPSNVVADETAGMCVPLLFLPAATTQSVWTTGFTLLIAFVAFRFFDIIKPPPADGLQRVPGGWGIVLDDLAAGVYALIVVQVYALLL